MDQEEWAWAKRFAELSPDNRRGALVVLATGSTLQSGGMMTEERWQSLFAPIEDEIRAAATERASDLSVLGVILATLSTSNLTHSNVFAEIMAKVFELGWLAARATDDTSTWDEVLDNL